MWEVVLEALVDSAKALPFLLAIYLVIEFLEHNHKAKQRTLKLLNGKFAPAVASVVGIVPQCGFSVMATDLYCQNYLKVGTLLAFFVATSDEALPILLTNSQTVGIVWVVVAIKVAYAMLIGFVVNAFDKTILQVDYQIKQDEGCCGHEMHDKKTFWQFVKHPLLHSAKIFVYIFVVNTVFGLLMLYFEQPIANFTAQIGVFQSLFTALVGLVPNCSSSVVLTGMYTENIIDLSALVAGLVSNSGIALAVLFKQKSKWKRNLLILAVLYLAGALLGTTLALFGL